MSNEYITILQECNGGIVEKKSKFLSNLFHVENEEEAKEKIKEIKKKYYDAKHHVFAYILFNNGNIIEKYSDDGEPSGTGGKPILEMMKQKGIYNVIVIVTRYFGGILLGTGGLTRAYTQSAKICLENNNEVTMVYANTVQLQVDYDELDKVKYYLETNNIIIDKIEYIDNILLSVIVKEEMINNFTVDITNVLNKKIDIKVIEQKYVIK